MKKVTRKATSIVKRGAIIVLGILCIALLIAAIITLSKILFKLFCICLAVYIVVAVVKTFISPMFRKK